MTEWERVRKRGGRASETESEKGKKERGGRKWRERERMAACLMVAWTNM